jgi:hypothetical protein
VSKWIRFSRELPSQRLINVASFEEFKIHDNQLVGIRAGGLKVSLSNADVASARSRFDELCDFIDDDTQTILDF